MEIPVDKNLVAYCGLYCGACRSYLKGKCPGCAGNEKLTWCAIRNCSIEHQYGSCSDCTLKAIEDCSFRHNFMSKFFSLFFGTDRDACIRMIRQDGAESFASAMAAEEQMSVKRKR